MHRVRLFAFGLAAFAFAAVASASEPRAAELHYTTESGTCPDEAAFRGQVMARLGYDPFARPGPTSRVEVTLRNTSRGPSAKLTVVRDDKPVSKDRLGTGETCAALAESLATTVAMALDPIAASAPKSEPEATAPPPPSAASPTGAGASGRPTAAPLGGRSSVEAPQLPPPRSSPPLTAHLGITGSSGIGELPATSIGGAIDGELRRGAFGGALGARFASGLGSFRSAQGDAVKASLLTAGGGPCLYVDFFAVCAELRLGSFHARSASVLQPANRSAFYAEMAVSGGIRVAIVRRLELFGVLELGAPLDPVTLRISADEVWNAPPIIGRLGAGARARLF